jgi:hypothetical protein
MSINKVPEGMISAEEFSKLNLVTTESVIAMIKDGYYVGRVIDDQWFVKPPDLLGASASSKITIKNDHHSNYEVARIFLFVITVLGWIFVAGGILAALVTKVELVATLELTVLGILLIVTAQLTQATIDNADNTREILNLIRENTLKNKL